MSLLAEDVRGCGDFMSFTRFCLLLQPYLARQAKRIFQEPREAGSFKGAVDAFTAEVDRADSHGAVLA